MHAATTQDHILSPQELSAIWQDLCVDPSSPDHFELTEHGEVVVSPRPTNRHQAVIAWVLEQLRKQLGGRAISELSVITSAGVRVPDASWLPADRWKEALQDVPLTRCPPIIVEVLSPGNRQLEMQHKIAAFLASGAIEVVVIDLRGGVHYHRTDGEFAASAHGLTLKPPLEMFSCELG